MDSVDKIFEKYEKIPDDSIEECILNEIFSDFIIKRHSDVMYSIPKSMPGFIGHVLCAAGGNIAINPFNNVLYIYVKNISICYFLPKYDLETMTGFEDFQREFLKEKESPNSNVYPLDSVINKYCEYYGVSIDTSDNVSKIDIAIKILKDWANKQGGDNGHTSL